MDVAVVGGGASGALVAAFLLRQARGKLRVALVERGGRAGVGVAYGTRRGEHLLNVPAGRMSADPEDPLQFVRWARARTRGAAPGSFLQRRLYGRYLRWFLDRAERGSSAELLRVRGEAVRISRAGGWYEVQLRGGAAVRARWVVLATGHAPPEPIPSVAPELRARGLVIEDPWRSALAELRPSSTVVLVGTGLTAVDALATLRARGHRGRIIAVSRHGLLPRAHVPAAPASAERLPRARSLSSLLAWVRRSGEAWRSALDVLRPSSAALWRGLGHEGRARFLRHLRAYWDVHRHRMPPALDAMVGSLLAGGRLEVVAGRVLGAAPDKARMRVRIRRRSGEEHRVEADLLVNCTGPAPVTAAPSALVRGLLEDGLASLDPLGLGLRTRSGRLVDRAGRPSPRLLVVGPLRRGELWETTAIPEIREQAKEAASRITGEATAGAGRRKPAARPRGRSTAARSAGAPGRVVSARS